MISLTLTFTWNIGPLGPTSQNYPAPTPVDPLLVELKDPSGHYGVKDYNGFVLTAPGTPMTRASAGVYTFTASSAASPPSPQFTFAVHVLYAGQDFYFLVPHDAGTVAAAGQIGTTSGYLDLATAASLAAALPSTLLPAWAAASASDQVLALNQGRADIDQSMKFQGRKYDVTQPFEFPRMAYEAAARVRNWGVMAQPVIPPGYGDIVWDWDQSNLIPFVPTKVLLANLYQADWILDGTKEERLDEQHAGVKATSGGGVSEDFDAKAPGVETGLSRRAYRLLWPYRAVSGRLM